MKIKIQKAAKDCGLYIIQALHKEYFKEWIAIDILRRDSQINANGLNVTSLINLGQNYGIAMEAYEVKLEDLKDVKSKMVGIIDNQGMPHFVIFWIKKNKYHLLDPALGKKVLKQKEFMRLFSGFIITFKKDTYIKKLAPNSKFNPYSYVFKNIQLLIWIFITIILAIIFSMFSTIYSKIIFDKIIPNNLSKTLLFLTLAFIFVGCLRVINEFIKKYLNKKMHNIIEIELSTFYMHKLCKGNIFEINKMEKTDHIRRLSLIPSVSLFLTTAIQVVFNEFLILIISIAMLSWISSSLLLIALIASVLLGIITIIFGLFLNPEYKKIMKLYQNEFRSKNELTYLSESIKKPKPYRKWYSVWQEHFINLKKKEYKIWKAHGIQEAFNSIISIITPIILTYFSVTLLFESKLSIGSMMMFLGLFHFFISPAIQLSDFMVKIKQNLINIQHLNYVFEIKEETLNPKGYQNQKLEAIQIENLKLSLDKPLLNINNFIIENNLHIQGENGTGKSLFLKCLSFLYPFKGAVSVNELEVQYWSQEYLRSRILYISPDEFIPTTTVKEYITLGNQENMRIFNENDKKYRLTQFLRKHNIYLEMMILNNGENFSLGQRQMIILMQIFAHDFDFLFLDEAFENISYKNYQWFKVILKDFTQLFVEVSHSEKYVKAALEVRFETINKNII